MSLKDIGIPQAIEFRGVDASRTIPFSLPHTEVVQQAKLNLHYSFSPALIAEMSHLNVLLNGTLIASLPAPSKTADVQDALSASVALPAELLVRDNVLGLQFIGHYTRDCEDPANSVLWARVENSTNIELSGSLLPLSDDLKILPLPFYDDELSGSSPTVPFVFAEQPTDYDLAGGRHSRLVAGSSGEVAYADHAGNDRQHGAQRQRDCVCGEAVGFAGGS